MLEAISLFTGAGGMDIGLHAAGFEVAVALEKDSTACETLRRNWDWNLIEDDVHSTESEHILAEAGLERGEVDLLVGGPPCQPFSKSGYWKTGDTDRLDDPRAGTLESYLRVLRDTLPKTFLLENVTGLVYRNKDEGIQMMKKVVNLINEEVGTEYSFEWEVLDTSEYGVPQARRRVFLIGDRNGRDFEFPSPTHGDSDDPQTEPLLTCWDAMGNLQYDTNLDHLEPGGKWADLLPSIPEGENYLYHTDRGEGLPLFGWRKRYYNFLQKLAKDQPSWTIKAKPGAAIGPFHWENRRLTKKELCRLQTFPDGYEIAGSRTEVQWQLGNAVPSLMAEILGREIRKQFFGTEISGNAKLMQSRAEEIPPPEPPQEVPEKYLDRVGDHAPHPGEGKGPLYQDTGSS